MGARIAVDCAFTLFDSDSRDVSLEFPLAAIFPSLTCDLRGGSLAPKAEVTDAGDCGSWACHRDRCHSINLPRDRPLRFAARLDPNWSRCGLALFRLRAPRFRI